MLKKEKISTLCLALAIFFNPFGFDAALLMAIKLTNGYWNAILLFYCLVGFFGISYYFYRKTILLFFALFFNPFGYDVLFALAINLTGSFITANLIFYFMALMFFGFYFYLVKIHPINYAINIFNNLKTKFLNRF